MKPKDYINPALENSYSYHAPKGNQVERYNELRNKAKELAHMIDELCPDSREKSVAQTNLEQAIMWANKSIACNEAGEVVFTEKSEVHVSSLKDEQVAEDVDASFIKIDLTSGESLYLGDKESISRILRCINSKTIGNVVSVLTHGGIKRDILIGHIVCVEYL